jgi:phosphopantothenoylcysteine synthetase/decarboxylase
MRQVLYVVACGGRPAGQLASFASFARDEGWDVCIILTPDATKFVQQEPLAELTGHPVRVAYKHPDEPDILPPPDAFVVAPATFNTVNKLAAGVSDTLALGLLNEAIGLGLPIIVVPWPSIQLSRHPAFDRSTRLLSSWGVTVILDRSRLPRATPGPAVFPWESLRTELLKLNTRSQAPRRRPASFWRALVVRRRA